MPDTEMTAEELQKLFPHASKQFLRINARELARQSAPPAARQLEFIGGGDVDAGGGGRSEVGDTASVAELEFGVRAGALAAGEAEGEHPGKFLVRVTSFRRRLLDEDNLCEKYHVDCCRYAGLLPGDSAAEARIETRQEKVGRKEDERTEIVIERISP